MDNVQVKNYIQFYCGEYAFILCTDTIAEITNIAMADVVARCEQRNGVLYYSWNNESIPVVNLNKRFGLDARESTHQLILDGALKQSNNRLMVVVGQVAGIIDAEESQFQAVQPLAGEFSKLVDATLIVKETNWLRIRSDYFY